MLSITAKRRAFIVINVSELAQNFVTERAGIFSVPKIKIVMDFSVH